MTYWLPEEGPLVGIGSLAASGVTRAYNLVLNDPVDGTNLDPGTIVGGRVELFLNTGLTGGRGAKYAVLVVPNNFPTLTVLADSDLKVVENYVWLYGSLETPHVQFLRKVIHLTTKRDFKRSDRVEVYLKNLDGSAWAVGAVGTALFDLYIAGGSY